MSIIRNFINSCYIVVALYIPEKFHAGKNKTLQETGS
jgi:hypothetical protein